MNVVITGADGFIARNLSVGLRERGHEVVPFTRSDPPERLDALVAGADAVVHLAGENRPADTDAFAAVNVGLTRAVCAAIERSGRAIPLVVSSSRQATSDTPYGRSKRGGEQEVKQMVARKGGRAAIFRLPNVFGKWSRPAYNSAVATFCHNLARGLPITVNEPAAALQLVYIDDVVAALLGACDDMPPGISWPSVAPEYQTTVGEVAEVLRGFAAGRAQMIADEVASGLKRALYATYISFLPTGDFAYQIPAHTDPRGTFVEFLKTRAAGQFSFFTAHPGITRGGHYHHSKTEKFLIVAGRARFRFTQILTGEHHQLETSADRPVVVETIPGWSHDVTNIGDDTMIAMVWANEVFDPQQPDTVAAPV